MQNLNEFNNNDLELGYWSKLNTKTQTQYAPIIDKKTKKYINILTPELKKQNKNITGTKRFMYMSLIKDNNYLELINNFIDPLENVVQRIISKNLNYNNIKNGYIELKFYNIDLSIIDSHNNITERQIISTSIDNNAKDINQYFNFKSKFKLNITPYICKHILYNKSYTYSIQFVCNKMLIIDGNNTQNIITQPKIFQDFKKKNMGENTNENTNAEIFDITKTIPSRTLEIHKYKITNNYNHNDTIITI
jgi:hypothetical protein